MNAQAKPSQPASPAQNQNNRNNRGKNLHRNVYRAVSIVIGIVCGLFLGICAVWPIIAGIWNFKITVSVLVSLLISIAATSALHAVGHLTAGHISGYKLISFKLICIKWTIMEGKIRLRADISPDLASHAVMEPPQKALPLQMHLFCCLGGLCMNVLTGVFSMLVIALFPSVFFITLGACNFLRALLGLLPVFYSNAPSDGKIIWSCIFADKGLPQLMLLRFVSGQLSAGIRPKEIRFFSPVIKMPVKTSEDVIAELEQMEIPHSTDDCGERDAFFPEPATQSGTDTDSAEPASVRSGYDQFTYIYRYLRDVDNENIDGIVAGLEAMNKLLDAGLFPRFMLNWLYYEQCFFYSLLNKPDLATSFHEKCAKKLKKDRSITACRVKAFYVYFVKNQPALAMELCKLGLKKQVLCDSPGLLPMERGLLNELKETISKATAGMMSRKSTAVKRHVSAPAALPAEEIPVTVQPPDTAGAVIVEQVEDKLHTVVSEQIEDTAGAVVLQHVEDTADTAVPEQAEDTIGTPEPEQAEDTADTVIPEQIESTVDTAVPEQTEDTIGTPVPEQAENTADTVIPETVIVVEQPAETESEIQK